MILLLYNLLFKIVLNFFIECFDLNLINDMLRYIMIIFYYSYKVYSTQYMYYLKDIVYAWMTAPHLEWLAYCENYRENKTYRNFIARLLYLEYLDTQDYNIGLVIFIIKESVKKSSFMLILFYIYMSVFTKMEFFNHLHISLTSKFLFINESEKEIGSLDDFFFFIILFINVVFFFILYILGFIIWNHLSLNWIYLNIIFVSWFIITIPLSVFIDFRCNFVNYIKGSSNTSNIFVELIFDMIAIIVIISRFCIQNIRFIFIFLTLFELFEWVNTTAYQFLFLEYSFTYTNFLNNINLFIINLILNICYYFYYILHLISILFIQFSIYILISIWLFFFLYINIFLNKQEKFFFFKKYN